MAVRRRRFPPRKHVPEVTEGVIEGNRPIHIGWVPVAQGRSFGGRQMSGSSEDSGEAGAPDSVAIPGQALRCPRMLARATVLLDQVRRIVDAGVEAVLAGRRRPKGNSEYPTMRIETLLEPRR